MNLDVKRHSMWQTVAKANWALIPLCTIAAVFWRGSPAIALLAGAAVALTVGNPWQRHMKGLTHRTLSLSVVGMGAGMNLVVVSRLGLHGLSVTIVSIVLALVLAAWLGKMLGISKDVSMLIGVGTAICGGSAIAAVAPAIRAKDSDITVALATVFLLNSIALLLFPCIGHSFQLNEDAFGLFCALAIHDTSSVVGAAAEYGPRALEVATATKLGRALWIVPLTLGITLMRTRQSTGSEQVTAKPKLPWFIAGFVTVAALVTYVPGLREPGALVALGARRLLTVTLFFVGLGLNRGTLRAMGLRPLIQGVLIWLCLTLVTLRGIVQGWLQ